MLLVRDLVDFGVRGMVKYRKEIDWSIGIILKTWLSNLKIYVLKSHALPMFPVAGCTSLVYTQHNIWCSSTYCRTSSPYVTRNQRQRALWYCWGNDWNTFQRQSFYKEMLPILIICFFSNMKIVYTVLGKTDTGVWSMLNVHLLLLLLKVVPSLKQALAQYFKCICVAPPEVTL